MEPDMSQNQKKSSRNETSQTPFPVLRTSKVLASGDYLAADAGTAQTIFPKEVPATLRLYLAGKIEQWWARQDQRPSSS